jgi:DNA-binding NtrC family response regulator
VLASRFLARYCATNGLALDAKLFSAEAMSQLQSYPWPGNIRELESTVSRAALSAPGRVIRDTDIEFLHAHASPASDAPPRLPTLRVAERANIIRALEGAAWNKKEAARILDISRGTLYRKIVECGLEPDPKASRIRTSR